MDIFGGQGHYIMTRENDERVVHVYVDNMSNVGTVNMRYWTEYLVKPDEWEPSWQSLGVGSVDYVNAKELIKDRIWERVVDSNVLSHTHEWKNVPGTDRWDVGVLDRVCDCGAYIQA